jgi:hypothetical protein
MRVVTNATNKTAVTPKFEVQDEAGSWQDITSRCFEFSGSDDLESDSNSITVKIRNSYSKHVEGTNNSLDPLDTNSSYYVDSAPLLGRYHACRLSLSKNSGLAYTQVFVGYIGPGSVSVTTDVTEDDIITVSPVDISQPYKEDFWYDPLIYRDADAVAIMTQMFADRGFNQAVVELDAPGYHIEEISTGETSLWDAQKSLVEPTGYVYRIRWDTGSSSFKPCVYDPERTKTTPDATFTGDFRSRSIDVNESDIRTKVVVIYRDRNSGATSYAESENEASRLKYGLPDGNSGRKHKTLWYASLGSGNRYSMIDTAGEAKTLANNIQSDLNAPSPDVEIALPYCHPGIEMHDLLAFVGNDYTVNVGVTGIDWSISTDNPVGETRITGTAERIIGQFRLWLERDANSPEMRMEADIALMQGDGLRPPQPTITRNESYWGFDSTTGTDTPIVVFECTPARVWDFRDYLWTYWIAGEAEPAQIATEEPRLVLKGMPVGAEIQVYVEVRDWSTVGG